MFTLVRGAFHADRVVFQDDAHLRAEVLVQSPLRPAHRHPRAVDVNGDVIGDGNQLSSDPAHLNLPESISPSPHIAENLATDSSTCRLAVGHHALRRAENGHSEAALNPWQASSVGVHPPAGTRDPLQAVNRSLALRPVLHLDLDAPVRHLAFDAETANVALARQQPGNLLL